MESKGAVTDHGTGASKETPLDSVQADRAFAQTKDYPGDRSPVPYSGDR